MEGDTGLILEEKVVRWEADESISNIFSLCGNEGESINHLFLHHNIVGYL